MLATIAMLLIQAPALEVTAEVDRNRLAVGETITFTLKAVGHSTAAFRIDAPLLDGFAVVDRRERTDVVTTSRETTRAYTLELDLRAEQVGSWDIGPIRVELGDASAFSPVVSVSVINASAGSSPGLEPDMLALIPRVPSPRPGGPSVFVVTSADAAFAGDQVNVLTAAWLPRGLRLRLRQPPTLTPPALPGVWSTPRASIPGAVASREVDGETYDLFVGFQTVYPLNPGVLRIPPARLSWVQPSGRPSSGDDQRRSIESPGTSLMVRDLPIAGRPSGFDGPVVRDLSLEYRLGQNSARAGAVLLVDIVVSGAGNLPLWPAPRVAWPAGARVYEEGTEGASRSTGQRLGGSKKFRYSVVPDSAGSLALPPLEYPFFDPGSGTYRTARAPGILVPVLDAAPPGDRRSPVPIEQPAIPSLVERIGLLGAPLLILLFALPVLAIAVLAWLARHPLRRRVKQPETDPALRLTRLVTSLVAAGAEATPRALSVALRRIGLERDKAERIIALHGALEAERFSMQGTGRATPELLRSIDAALSDIPPKVRRLSGLAAALIAAVLLGGATTRLSAQAGIELYHRGEYDAAARAFELSARAARHPSPAYWYDLAAAEFMARRDAEAAAALMAARARAPRDPQVKALWNALAREHDPLRRSPRAWPFNAEECMVAALGMLWLALALRIIVRRLPLWIVAVILAAVAGVSGLSLRAERNTSRAVLVGGASLRISPHGLATESGTVPAYSVVRLLRTRAGWFLVETPDGAAGWVPREILAPIPALD